MGKIRRVDFFPDEFLSGVDQLSLEEIGVYWLVCSKIYSRSAGLPDDDRGNALALRLDLRIWKRLKASLIAKGKLKVVDNTIINTRCMAELSKAYKRIEDAKKNGALGGRPPIDRPEISPTSSELPANFRHTSGLPRPLSPAEVADKSLHELNGNNGVTKARGFSGEKLTSNQQPPTTKEETSSPENKIYAFNGRVIRLTAADFNTWQTEFRETIPDLMAQLADDDAYYDRALTGKDRTKWFHRLHRKLLRYHQSVLGERARDRRPDLSESF